MVISKKESSLPHFFQRRIIGFPNLIAKHEILGGNLESLRLDVVAGTGARLWTGGMLLADLGGKGCGCWTGVMKVEMEGGDEMISSMTMNDRHVVRCLFLVAGYSIPEAHLLFFGYQGVQRCSWVFVMFIPRCMQYLQRSSHIYSTSRSLFLEDMDRVYTSIGLSSFILSTCGWPPSSAPWSARLASSASSSLAWLPSLTSSPPSLDHHHYHVFLSQ